METENNKCLVYFNGELIKNVPSHVHVLWHGQFSEAYCNGAIVNFVEACLSKIKNNLLCVIPANDGNYFMKDMTLLNDKEKHMGLINIKSILDEYQPTSKKIIIATLAQLYEDPEISYLYLPLSDYFFVNGAFSHFEKELIPWEDRQSIAFWRGGCSGYYCNDYIESARYRTVNELLHYKNTNVKLTKRFDWHLNRTIPEEYFDAVCELSDFFKYKIVLIIDGNTIASSHMWTFATGAVPVMISNAKCWFSPFLKPFVNYVPVQYDLSNLRETIEWLIMNDEKAKEIAENALLFSKEYFSSEFQKKYIEDELQKINLL